MKRAVKIVLAIVVSATGLSLSRPLQAQPGASLPSDEAWQTIQSASEYSGATPLPSEKAYADLKARPTGEIPIGGLDAPLPDASLPVLITFALTAAAATLWRKKRKFT